MSGELTLNALREFAESKLIGSADGPDLLPVDADLISFGLASSTTCLNMQQAEIAGRAALAHGANTAQLNAVLILISGLGLHSLMQGAVLVEQLGDNTAPTSEITKEQQALWAKYIGADKYWDSFELHVPKFLKALLRQSPASFAGFFEFCALPWKTRALSALQMELISLAVDCAPTHRFGPGMRLHLENAVKLGAGRAQILGTLDIAAAAPLHCGVA